MPVPRCAGRICSPVRNLSDCGLGVVSVLTKMDLRSEAKMGSGRARAKEGEGAWSRRCMTRERERESGRGSECRE